MLRTHPFLLPAAGLAIWILLAFGPEWAAQGRVWFEGFERAGVHFLTRPITKAR